MYPALLLGRNTTLHWRFQANLPQETKAEMIGFTGSEANHFA
jgi:hypothetical protein